MAMTLSQLQSQLSGMKEYKPESEAALRKRATAVYDPQYNQDLESLRDSLQQQVNATERGAIRTGMQRSSYNNASLVGLVGAGQKAQAQLAAQREGNVANLLLQLMQGEQERKQAADQQRDNLLLNIYNLQQAAKRGSGSGKKTGGVAMGTPARHPEPKTPVQAAKTPNLSTGVQNIVNEFLTNPVKLTQPTLTQPTLTQPTTTTPVKIASGVGGGGGGKKTLLNSFDRLY